MNPYEKNFTIIRDKLISIFKYLHINDIPEIIPVHAGSLGSFRYTHKKGTIRIDPQLVYTEGVDDFVRLVFSEYLQIHNSESCINTYRYMLKCIGMPQNIRRTDE